MIVGGGRLGEALAKMGLGDDVVLRRGEAFPSDAPRLEMDGNGWKMDGNGWKWMEMDGNGWKWMEDGWKMELAIVELVIVGGGPKSCAVVDPV